MRAALINRLRVAAARQVPITSNKSKTVLPAISAATITATATSTRTFAAAAAASAGNILSNLAKESPHVDVVRYEHKNRTWTLKHVEFFSEALAIGLAENGLIPGDTVLCWLPLHFSEAVSFVLFYTFIQNVV